MPPLTTPACPDPSCVPHVQIGFVSVSGGGKTTLIERMALMGFLALPPPEGVVPERELEAMLEAL